MSTGKTRIHGSSSFPMGRGSEHPGSVLLISALGRLNRMRQEIGRINIERNGPVMRLVRAVDRGIRAVGRLVRPSK